ncbi:MAG: amino acid adenylation domain-containing protein, partial [Ferruginibacter sp.]
MKNKQFNKTLVGKTGKDLIGLMGAKGKPVQSLDIVAPAGETELALFEFWQSLLGHKNFGVKDDFFKIGGNSLKAIQLLSRILAQFHVQLTLTEIFLNTTIAQIAELIQDKQNGISSLPAIVEVKEKPELIPLSYNQERIWFIDQLEGSTQYHIPAVLRLIGKINIEALSFALKQIINRHEVLRTTIRENGGDRYQQINNITDWEMRVIDGTAYSNNPEDLQLFIQQLINTPFELSKDYMLRAALIKLQETEHVLVVTMHHIAADGWSAGIIINELVQLYKAFETGADAALQPLQIQYADFAIWQRQYLDGPLINKELNYWKAKLEDVSPLQMPTDFARTATQSFNGNFEEFTIDKNLTEQLHELGHQQGVTLFMTLLAAFKVLLYRYSGQQDISVGTAIAGRKQQELEGLVGFFVNTLTLRDNVDNKQSFTELLQQVKTTTLEAFEHQELPFEKVVEAVVKNRDLSRTPLFQVLFVLQNTPEKQAIELGELALSEEPFEKNKAKFELDISLSETPDGMLGTIEYCTDLYSEQTINQLTQHYIQLLQSIVKNAVQPIGELPMLMEDEKEHLLVKLNNTEVDYPTNKTYVDLFEEQVKKTPEVIAVAFDGQELSYKMLDEKSNQLGHYLRKLGVKEETLVPICLDRSLEMIVGILGILKAGAAYVPIDPEYPEDRLSYMLEDTAATIIITTDDSKAVLPLNDKCKIISLDADWENIAKQPATKVANDLKVNNPAYIIYTSGSTGKPKGVINEHGGLVNRLLWAQDNYKLTETDVFLQKTTFCFDVSVTELCWPLITGSKLVFAKPGGHRDADYLQKIIHDEKVTIIHFVPSMLGVFLSTINAGDCPELKQVICSGEALKPSQANLFIEKLATAKLHNLYGPTEAAVDVTCWTLGDFDTEIKQIPIGKPVANTAIYILDKDNNLAPMGGVGEIHIGGVQVARGYLNRPELTKEKFITDPFSKVPGARMYRTGDLGRWQQDGNIAYLGRIDDQVKIRGFRIELGEIEECLAGLEGVKNAKVLVIEDDASFGKKLCAYLEIKLPISSFDNNEFIQQVKGGVGKVLPDYMVPTDFILLDKFPLTANGKINKKALPAPERSTTASQAYLAPKTASEKALVNSWQQLLGKEKIGINDNFFELGGHSLLGMSLVSAIRRDLNVELSIRSLFDYPTISELANHLEDQTNNVLLPDIEVEIRPQYIPLSYSQERLWFI